MQVRDNAVPAPAQGKYFPRLFELTGKVAVVTGGGGGLGEAMCLGLADAGADVVIVDVNEAAATRVSGEVRSLERRSLALQGDVRDSERVNQCVARILEEFGTIDILINSAGTARRYWAEDLPEQAWNDVQDINLKGTFLWCQAVGRHMIQRGGGKIINIASIGGFVAYPESIAYLASKGGVVQLTRGLAVEWAKYNINVNGIAPCLMNTELVRKYRPDLASREWFITRTPVGRLGECEELIGAAIFLASDASSLVTGHTLAADGGYLAE